MIFNEPPHGIAPSTWPWGSLVTPLNSKGSLGIFFQFARIRSNLTQFSHLYKRHENRIRTTPCWSCSCHLQHPPPPAPSTCRVEVSRINRRSPGAPCGCSAAQQRASSLCWQKNDHWTCLLSILQAMGSSWPLPSWCLFSTNPSWPRSTIASRIEW